MGRLKVWLLRSGNPCIFFFQDFISLETCATHPDWTMDSTLFEKMTSLENLFLCWIHFKRGKRKRKDIQTFERYLEDHIFQLHEDLMSGHYKHGLYHRFHVFDPKERYISKASVRDRLVHQMVYSALAKI